MRQCIGRGSRRAARTCTRTSRSSSSSSSRTRRSCPGAGRRSSSRTSYVDITGKFLDLKLKAYSCHKSQVRPEPSQAGLGAIRLMAESRGREISVEAAEAFECHRFVL